MLKVANAMCINAPNTTWHDSPAFVITIAIPNDESGSLVRLHTNNEVLFDLSGVIEPTLKVRHALSEYALSRLGFDYSYLVLTRKQARKFTFAICYHQHALELLRREGTEDEPSEYFIALGITHGVKPMVIEWSPFNLMVGVAGHNARGLEPLANRGIKMVEMFPQPTSMSNWFRKHIYQTSRVGRLMTCPGPTLQATQTTQKRS